ncbi:MAG TPA: hypothetical protein DDZ84_04680 [Firmicutes bacterium]|nr:hypothetical protein [Bacillota bacterium]
MAVLGDIDDERTEACYGGVTVLKVFAPQNLAGPTVAAVMFLGAAMLVMFWAEIAAGGVRAVVVVCTWIALALMAWSVSRSMAKRKIVIDGNTLELIKGSSSRKIDLSSVEALEQRRGRIGRRTQTRFFARLANGESVELFADGQYSDQAGLKSAIEEAAGKSWTVV